MRDLTNYADDKLSLVVFDEEYFYIERDNEDYLIALCREEFHFTDAQLSVLKVDLADDRAQRGLT